MMVDRKRLVATLSEACARTGWQDHAQPGGNIEN
jgi:hypothetical protein